MAMPLRQSIRLGAYLAKQKLQRREKYAVLVELEPLFACNLKCGGCGKIQQPAHLLKQRMPVQQAVGAVEESGAPMVSIAGGEPLMHPQIHEITRILLERGKIVFLCTNALLLPKHIDKFKPHRNFSWMVHIDGLAEKHDASVRKEGGFQAAVDAIRLAKEKGFRVMTNTTFFNTDTPQDVIDVLDYLNDEVGVDNMQLSPGYAYEKAPDQEHFLGVQQTRELFSKAFGDGRRTKWRLNHSPLFLDFIEGKRAVGYPVVLAAGLAAPVLPPRRRLREDLPRADRGDGVGQVRPRQGPALRELHGPLRLRADGGDRHDEQPEGNHPGSCRGVSPGG